MAADKVELLPLGMPRGDVGEGGLDWTDDEMTTYASANVAHATATKDAEIARLTEALEFQSALTKNLLPYQDEAVAGRAEIEALRAKTAVTMGVGTGDGNLFVYGDYESIKAAQAIVLQRDALRDRNETMLRAFTEREAALIRRAQEAEAEIEALRAEVNTAKGQAEFYRTERNKNQRKAEQLSEALRDLLSWFPEKPAPSEWRICAGEQGADDAIEYARAALNPTAAQENDDGQND